MVAGAGSSVDHSRLLRHATAVQNIKHLSSPVLSIFNKSGMSTGSCSDTLVYWGHLRYKKIVYIPVKTIVQAIMSGCAT